MFAKIEQRIIELKLRLKETLPDGFPDSDIQNLYKEEILFLQSLISMSEWEIVPCPIETFYNK